MRTARLRVWALAAVIALQVAVPLAVRVAQEPPSRFGFTMYSGREKVDVVIEDAQGRPLTWDHRTTIAAYRPEIDWVRYLPARLCRDVPGAHTVSVSQADREGTWTCD